MDVKYLLGIFSVLILLGIGFVQGTPSLSSWNEPTTIVDYTKVNYSYFNISFTLASANANDTVKFNWNGTNRTLLATNCSLSSTTLMCHINETSLSPDGNWTYYFWINETDGTEYQSWSGTAVFDKTDPVSATETIVQTNGTGSTEMKLTWTSYINDSNPSQCYINAYPSNTSVATSYTYGTYALNIGENYTATISIGGGDVGARGVFTIEPHVNDSAGNSAVGTNITDVVVTYLYGNAWNLISSVRNTTLYDIGLMDSDITHVSVYDNNASTYTNYVVGVITNNATEVEEGQAVYVFLSGSNTEGQYLMQQYVEDASSENDTILHKGWNQLSTFNTTGILFNELCDKTLTNQTDGGVGNYQEIQYVSQYDAKSKLYKTHRCDFSIYENLTLEYGEAVWVLLNGTNSGNWSSIDMERS